LTHIALPVKDYDKSLAFYERYTSLERVLEKANEESGLRSVWLADPDRRTEAAAQFVIVLLEGGKRKGAPADAKEEYGFLTSIAHFGISVDSREAVDEIAARAEQDGILVLGPTFRNEITGYIALIRDPDGNNVEFSYGQVLG
jgi:catechol 2,3-dioxygenase-like lactoylglutathione lyase family enzyme